MVHCHFCNKGASLQFYENNVRFYTCSPCKDEKNIQNAYSRLNCIKCVNFGGWTFQKKRYCFNHKPEGAVSSSPKCIVCCDTNATFGIRHEPPLYCFHCCDKTIHVNVKTKKCIICNKNAYFKLLNETTPKYCGECKLPGMKSIKSKYCNECDNQAYYGYVGESPKKCSSHKLSDMILFKH